MDCSEGPPVPIPNTEVKLTSAENTWVATPWEDRETPTLNKRLSNRIIALIFFKQIFANFNFILVFSGKLLYNILSIMNKYANSIPKAGIYRVEMKGSNTE